MVGADVPSRGEALLDRPRAVARETPVRVGPDRGRAAATRQRGHDRGLAQDPDATIRSPAGLGLDLVPADLGPRQHPADPALTGRGM